MTPERAQYILDNRLDYGSYRWAYVPKYCVGSNFKTYPDGITEEENAFVHKVWETMPGYTCYDDALRTIANPPKFINNETLWGKR